MTINDKFTRSDEEVKKILNPDFVKCDEAHYNSNKLYPCSYKSDCESKLPFGYRFYCVKELCRETKNEKLKIIR